MRCERGDGACQCEDLRVGAHSLVLEACEAPRASESRERRNLARTCSANRLTSSSDSKNKSVRASRSGRLSYARSSHAAISLRTVARRGGVRWANSGSGRCEAEEDEEGEVEEEGEEGRQRDQTRE